MKRCAVIVALAACALVPKVVRAETLADAITLAYQTNPLIRSQRAALRAIDEEYAQAMAGYRPTIAATGQGGYQYADLDQQSFAGGYTATHEKSETGQIDLSFVQPLYTGGVVRARVNEANADIMAGRENLRQSEGQLLLQVITAYVNVRHDRQVIEILDEEAADLGADVAEARAGNVLGQTSQTDLDLAKVRLLNLRLQILQARATLGSDQAIYLDLVGQSPGALEPEPELKSLPDSIDTAFDVAEGNNPNLRAAIQTELSARAKVAETKAGNAPNFSLKLDGSIAPLAPYLPREFDRSASALITYTQSFFTGGLYSSNVRGAIEQDNKAIMTVESTRRQVIQNIAQAWSQYVNAKKSMDIEKEFIVTARSEVNGDRLEHRAGQRGELDVLNGESDYISARLSYSQSHHDTYVAAITLINAMGLLKVRFLADDIQEYRPETSFERQARKGGMPLDGVAGWLDSIHAPAAPAPISSSLTAGGRRPADVEP